MHSIYTAEVVGRGLRLTVHAVVPAKAIKFSEPKECTHQALSKDCLCVFCIKKSSNLIIGVFIYESTP
jgi:hypothetical protein